MRTKKSVLNFITSFFPWLILALLGFIKIKYFIQYFGSEMNGLIQLVGQVYAYLGLMELGFGAAIVFKLYKPFAEGDTKKISQLFAGAKKIYKAIGLSILLLGIVISIVIPYFISDLSISKSYVTTIFALYSLEYFTLYFFGLSYQTLLTADQKQYKINIVHNARAIVFKLIEIILIINKVGLIIILSLGILTNIISSIIIIMSTKKQYPWLDKNAVADTEPLRMTKDVIVHKISGLVFSKTDAIVLALFSGLSFVSIYSAYHYIIVSLEQMLSFLFSSVKDGFGDLYARENVSVKRKNSAFKELLILSFYFALLIVPIFNVAIIPFIKIWINNTYEIHYSIVILFSIYLWYIILLKPLIIMRNASGLYKESKGYILLQSIVNMVLSIVLVFKYNIFGILLATAIALVTISLPFEVRLVYKKIINESIWNYVKLYITNVLILICIIVINTLLITILNLYNVDNLFHWAVSSLVIGIIDLNLITLVFYIFSNSFRLLIKRFFKVFTRKELKNDK